jgi:hypothetical protein
LAKTDRTGQVQVATLNDVLALQTCDEATISSRAHFSISFELSGTGLAKPAASNPFQVPLI